MILKNLILKNLKKGNIKIKQDKETKAWSLYYKDKEIRTVDKYFASCFFLHGYD